MNNIFSHKTKKELENEQQNFIQNIKLCKEYLENDYIMLQQRYQDIENFKTNNSFNDIPLLNLINDSQECLNTTRRNLLLLLESLDDIYHTKQQDYINNIENLLYQDKIN